MNARAISSTLAYKHTNYSFYRYVVEDGETRIVEDDPVQSHPKDTNNEASFGNPTSFTTGGENPSSFQKARKVFLVNGPPISGGKFGPGRLESAGFHSQTGGGTTFWYASQDTSDLEYPPKNTPTPQNIGTVYLHRDMSDGGYQLWVWQPSVAGAPSWHAVSIDSSERVWHPLISDRVLHLTSGARPSWILSSTKTTYGSRHSENTGSRKSSTPH